MDHEDSWYNLTLGIVHQDKPATFGPQDINPFASHSFTGSHDAGMCTRNGVEGFWDSILINAVSRTVLENFLKNLIVCTTARERTNGSHYYIPRTDFFVDKMISPGYFKDQSSETFGPIVYVLEHCGTCFLVILHQSNH